MGVWYGTKYTPQVAQDSKINSKWMNTKMLENLRFFNGDLAKDIPAYGHPKLSEAAVRTCIIT